MNGTIIYTSNSTSFSGCAAASAGEINTLGEQMPGEVNSHETITNQYVRNASNNGWFQSYLWYTFAQNEDNGNDASQYFGNAASGWPLSEDDIWDKACSG